MTTAPAPSYASRAEHRAGIRRSPLLVRVQQVLTVTTEIDVAGWFAGFTATQRAAYWATDVASPETGGECAAWERPYAYLTGHAAEATDVLEPMLGDCALATVDETGYEDRVSWRGGEPAGLNRYWTEADYDTLVAQVPWLAPEAELTAAELARVPGPLDTPLW